jgi:transcriptional regulator with XRE-family HTH domain
MKNLRDFRTAAGFSREALAARLGISVTWLGQLERQPIFLTPAMARRIAAALGVDPGVLLAGRLGPVAIRGFAQRGTGRAPGGTR